MLLLHLGHDLTFSFCKCHNKLSRAHHIKCASNRLVFNHKAVLEPRVSPAFAIAFFCNHCNIRFENTSKYVDTLTLFSKTLNQRSLTPRWPLTRCLLRSHVWLYLKIIVSKSHDNQCMWIQWWILQITTYTYILHTYILHTYYVQNEWSHSLLLNSVQARQKWAVLHHPGGSVKPFSKNKTKKNKKKKKKKSDKMWKIFNVHLFTASNSWLLLMFHVLE